MQGSSNGISRSGYGECHYVSISKASLALGISPASLRQYERSGLIEPVARTLCNGKHGHRRYNLETLRASVLGSLKTSILGANGSSEGHDTEGKRVVCCYARVSSQNQHKAGNLERQIGRLTTTIAERESIPSEAIRVYKDVASSFGIRPGLNSLISDTLSGKVERIYVEFADRLSRIVGMSRLIEFLCERSKVQLVCLDKEVPLEEEAANLAELIDFITVISNRRSARKNADRRRMVLAPEIVTTIRTEVASGRSIREIVDKQNAIGTRDSKGRKLGYSSTTRLLAKLQRIMPPVNAENSFATFIRQEVFKSKNGYCSASMIHAAYAQYCASNRVDALPARNCGTWLKANNWECINKGGYYYYLASMPRFPNMPDDKVTGFIRKYSNNIVATSGVVAKPFKYNAPR